MDRLKQYFEGLTEIDHEMELETTVTMEDITEAIPKVKLEKADDIAPPTVYN